MDNLINLETTVQVVKSPYDARDYTISADKELPEKYSLPAKVPVKNQGTKPTCVAHALASLVEYHNKVQNDNNYRAFSTEFIYGTRDIGYYVGDGMAIRDALKTIQKYGDPYKTDCPGNNDVAKAMETINAKVDAYRELAYPHRISTYYKVNNEDEIKTALYKHGPVVVSMNTYEGATIENDIYTYDKNAKSGRHCVLLYGWDERGWLVQNSWGTLYAGDGRFVIPYDYKFNEAWGVTDDINSPEVNVKKRNAFTNFIYKVYNAIVNWWLKVTDKT